MKSIMLFSVNDSMKQYETLTLSKHELQEALETHNNYLNSGQPHPGDDAGWQWVETLIWAHRTRDLFLPHSYSRVLCCVIFLIFHLLTLL